ncbi:MAG: hypothetical protein Q9178_001982 [Gyalolechia marmorata]
MSLSVYQEYLAKSLTDKYNNLGTQVDKIIHDANTEITTLNQKLRSKARAQPRLQIEREKLQSENTNLVQAFREKTRKHQQTQELYDRLKRKEMAAVTQSAAFESVDDVLGNVGGRIRHGRAPQPSFLSRQQGQEEAPQYQYDANQDPGHRRDGGNGSGGNEGIMPPPPLRRPAAFGGHVFASNQHTPSQHRTQLGLRTETHLQNGVSRVAPGMSHLPTPSQRLPLGTMGPSSVNRPNVGGYGMSAGLKVGRQQGKPIRDV